MSDSNKIWIRFQSKLKNGDIIKLRIQGQTVEPGNEVYEFLLKYFIRDEAVHKAAGVAKSEDAVKEYRELMNKLVGLVPLHATVCCVDNDTNNVEKILGVSLIQLMRSTDKLEDLIEDMEFKTEEMQQLLYAAKVLDEYTKEKAAYEIFYYGRGIIVDTDYRRLGIAHELVRARKLICIDQDIPMSCAWMSSLGTQKAADKNNWKTMSEVSLEELEEKTGLTFEDRIPSFKFMYTTAD